MSLISVPKPLRDKLGIEASDSLVELLQKQSSEQKEHLFEVLEDRFAHRLVALESRLMGEMHSMEKGIREDMNHGFQEVHKQFGEVHKQFGEVQKQFGEVQKQFVGMQKQVSDIHKAISSQTKWILVAMLGAAVLYPIVQKLLSRI